MYHIKRDLRMQKSAELLFDGLLGLLEEKPLEKVSISDLQRATGVGRTTFYRAFDRVEDVLRWKCDSQFRDIIYSFAESGESEPGELLVHVLRGWMADARVVEALFAAKRHDIAYQSFIETSDVVVNALREYGRAMGEAEATYFLSVRAGWFIGIMDAWLRCGKRQTPEQVAAIAASIGSVR